MWWLSPASTSPSPTVSCSSCSARPGAASRRCCGSSPAWSGSTRGACGSAVGMSPASRRADATSPWSSRRYALFPHLTVAENIGFGLAVRGRSRVGRHASASRPRPRRSAASTARTAARGALRRRATARGACAGARARARMCSCWTSRCRTSTPSCARGCAPSCAGSHDAVGGTTVHVTHDQIEALALGDRVAVLRAGALEQVGTPDELWHAPGNRFVARFVGSPGMNVVPADGPFVVDRLPAGRALEVGVRPEHVTLTGEGTRGESSPSWSTVGDGALVYVRAGRRRDRGAGRRRPAPGSWRRGACRRAWARRPPLRRRHGRAAWSRRERASPAPADACAVRLRARRPGGAAGARHLRAGADRVRPRARAFVRRARELPSAASRRRSSAQHLATRCSSLPSAHRCGCASRLAWRCSCTAASRRWRRPVRRWCCRRSCPRSPTACSGSGCSTPSTGRSISLSTSAALRASRCWGQPLPQWLTDPGDARAAIVLISLFTIGEGFVLLLVARQAVPPELYELAEVEDATAWVVAAG